MMTSLSATKRFDEFDSDEFGPGIQTLPYLQVLNHENPNKSGFFISADNVAAVNFSANQEWEAHEAQFASGGATMGYRSLVARLVILRRSPLLMFQRSNKDFIGVYDDTKYDPSRVVLKTRYLVYLVDKQKQLLHDIPLQFTAKGSICGSFGEHYAQFRTEMNQAYGKPRGDRFFALSVFAVKLMPVLKGREKKSWVCSIEKHGVPTPENWQGFFLGYNPALKERLLREFDEFIDFGSVHRTEVNEFADIDF